MQELHSFCAIELQSAPEPDAMLSEDVDLHRLRTRSSVLGDTVQQLDQYVAGRAGFGCLFGALWLLMPVSWTLWLGCAHAKHLCVGTDAGAGPGGAQRAGLLIFSFIFFFFSYFLRVLVSGDTKVLRGLADFLADHGFEQKTPEPSKRANEPTFQLSAAGTTP